MNFDECHAMIDQWSDRMQEVDARIAALGESLGLYPDGALMQLLHEMQEDYTQAVAEAVGDLDGDWLNWFRFENDFGARGQLAALGDAPLMPVRSTEELTELIVLTRRDPYAQQPAPCDVDMELYQ